MTTAAKMHARKIFSAFLCWHFSFSLIFGNLLTNRNTAGSYSWH